MTVHTLAKNCGFDILCDNSNDPEIKSIYCCDLLSIVMGKAPEGCAWVTVMGNINSVAVATLTDMSCIILSTEARIDDNALEKAIEKKVIILKSQEPIFETSLKVHEAITNEQPCL